MNEAYWKNFYKTKKISIKPTSFARFCLDYLPEDCFLYDLGCGNGRDSYFFGKHCQKVVGVDNNILPLDKRNVEFMATTAGNIFLGGTIPDAYEIVIYSRFFLNSISCKEIIDLILEIKKGYFMAECRSIGDEPRLYKIHKRNFVDGEWLLTNLIRAEFKIMYYQKSRELAKYKNEDPLVLRVIAQK